MKTKELIRQNLMQKLGGYLSGYGGEEIKAHIIMLDWVLSDGTVRSLDEILKDYALSKEGVKNEEL